MTRVGAAIVGLAVLAALVGPMIVPFDPADQELAGERVQAVVDARSAVPGRRQPAPGASAASACCRW